jgi:hypothetical protein
MAEIERKPSLTSCPEALLVAALTAAAYWLAFLYQAFYLRFFHFPPSLTEISIQSILLVMFGMAALSIIFWSVDIVGLFSADDPIRLRLLFPSIFLIWLWVWIWYFGFKFIYLLALIPAIYVLLSEVFFAVAARGRWNRLARWERYTRPTMFMAGIMRRFGPRAYEFVAVVILLSVLACIIGFGEATTQKVFFVFTENRDVAVIQIYNDRILAVPFDRTSKTFGREAIIRKIHDVDIKLTIDKDVGPLTSHK